jgi:hypothetical protein
MKGSCLQSTTPCNYCALREYRRVAEQTDRAVALRPKPLASFPHGQDVFIHPPGIPDDELAPWRAGWLGSTPEFCEC